MPEFVFTSPDGVKYSVTGPEGATHEQAFSILQQQLGAQKPAAASSAPKEDITAGMALSGAPIIGAYVPQAEAALQAAIHPLTGAGEPGATFSERYAKTLPKRQELYRGAEEAQPGLSAVAKAVGGTAALAPLGLTATGARLLGAVPGGLGRQMVASGVSGAGLGAADSAVHGHDVGTGAGISAGLGVLGPVAGRVIGSGIQGARNLIGGMRTPPVPANTMRVGNVDVPLSSGQATGDVAAQTMENAALRGGSGQAAQHVAEGFFRGEQAPAIENARANIGAAFDRNGQHIATNPQEAAELASQRVQDIEAASRRQYGRMYDDALARPGEFDAGAFEGVGQRIKGRLTLGQSPVIIDDVTTPIASRMIQDVDNHISQLRVQNRADPFGQPNPENIVGINLAGVDQTRKRLVSMASSAQYGSADRRAAGRVISEFDNHVEDAMSQGLFRGDDRALDAIRAARAAYSQHRQAFRSQGAGDDVGRTMERIVGRNGGEGATPTEVANWLYGNAKVGGTGLSVRLAQRMQHVLGADSPEWAGVRQGLWARLTHATEGTTEMGAQKSMNRIAEFLNGSGAPLAHVMFTPQERALMQRYADLQRQINPRPGTVNYSNTATVMSQMAQNAMRGIFASLGAVATGGPAGLVMGIAGGPAARALSERSAAGRIARSLYRSPAQNAAEALFIEQMGRRGALGSRLLTGPDVGNQQQARQ